MSHDRLTAGFALNLFKSLAQALSIIAQHSTSAVFRSNALSNLKVVNELMQQVGSLPFAQPFGVADVQNFCLGTKFVELVVNEDPQGLIVAARDVHVAALKGILKCLDNPEACPLPKTKGEPEKKTEKKRNWGLILGLTGGAILAGVALYLYSTRNRVPSRAAVR